MVFEKVTEDVGKGKTEEGLEIGNARGEGGYGFRKESSGGNSGDIMGGVLFPDVWGSE